MTSSFFDWQAIFYHKFRLAAMRCPYKRNTYIQLPHPTCLHISAAAPPPRTPHTSVVHHPPPLTSIVGYQASNITGGIYYMIAAQFDDVNGNGAGIAIKDLVTGDIPYGAEMQVRLPAGGYDIYKYIAEAYDENLDDFVPGWADGLENLATTKIAPGAAFWFKTDSNCNVNIAGKILEDASKL